MAITNKDRVIKKAKKMGYELGCYSKHLNNATPQMMKRVLDAMDYYSHTDVDISIKRVPHVVEIGFVDNEIDLVVMTKNEYIGRYGDERYTDDW